MGRSQTPQPHVIIVLALVILAFAANPQEEFPLEGLSPYTALSLLLGAPLRLLLWLYASARALCASDSLCSWLSLTLQLALAPALSAAGSPWLCSTSLALALGL